MVKAVSMFFFWTGLEGREVKLSMMDLMRKKSALAGPAI